MNPRRLLVRGVNWLGDAVMTTPALERLRERFPKAQITLLTSESLANLFQDHPAIDAVLTFRKGESVWAVGRRIRAEGFDLALVLPNSPRSALEVWLGGVPSRWGYARSWRNWWLTRAVPYVESRSDVRMTKLDPAAIRAGAEQSSKRLARDYREGRHHTLDYLNLVGAMGASTDPTAPSIVVSAEERDAMTARLSEASGGAMLKGWLGLNPGAEYGAAKRWPADHFVSAAVQVCKQTQCGIVITGGPADRGTADTIAGGIREALGEAVTVANLAGKTSLRELCAVLAACRVVLTNDTGPMHVAAAVGARLVVPFGSTSPELTGPGLPGDPRHRFLQSDAFCSPCFLRECPIDFRCMRGIGTDSVADAVLAIWREPEETSTPVHGGEA